jgi:intein-encoded DNA endonuclease-like protein
VNKGHEYLCNKSSGSETLQQSTQESSRQSSLIINSTTTIEDVETYDDDVPIKKISKRRRAT